MKLTKIMTIVATGLLMAASLSSAEAKDRYGFSSFKHYGSACSGHSVDHQITNDGKTLTVLFDDYEVEVGGKRANKERKRCTVKLKIRVPQGFTVGLLRADYRGYTDLPKGATAKLKREYFFSGQAGANKTKRWSGARDKSYFVRDQTKRFTTAWGACGRDVNLKAKTSLQVKSPQGKEASAALDSVDVKGRMIYNIRWKKCD